MSRFRSWVVWLLMAVLPWQGMAVAAMVPCGPADPGASVQAFHGSHHDNHAVVGAEPTLLAAAAADDADASLTSGTLAHASAAGGHLLQHCCGAACTLAFATSAAPCDALQSRPPAPLQGEARLSLGVVPDRLDRPPQD